MHGERTWPGCYQAKNSMNLLILFFIGVFKAYKYHDWYFGYWI